MPRKSYYDRMTPEQRDEAKMRTNKWRANHRGPKVTKFIGVDGEGWTDAAGVHRYAMLSVGDDTLFGVEHLDFLEIMEFLWTAYEANPTAAFVGFYLGYDFAQWLRTLPEDRAFMLLDKEGKALRRHTKNANPVPFPVRFGGWEFDLLGMKRFKLRKEGEKGWMSVCDTGPFFQQSFISAIDPVSWPDGSPATDEQFRIIMAGKAKRADEHTSASWLAAQDELTLYNVTENLVLANVMGRYELGLHSAGVQLRKDQWYGPGAAAQSWLGSVGLLTRESAEALIPAPVLEFGRESYYGGWFEVFAHGHIPGKSYEYDINSAYPAAMAEMPCWEHMDYRWTNVETIAEIEAPYALLDATLRGSDPHVGVGLHRDRDGSILRPQCSRGVRWLAEIQAGIAAGVVDDVRCHRVLEMAPREGCGCVALVQGIPHIYRERLRVGKNTAHGKAFKLIYNSAYGKQAQSIGSPKYSNPLSASFITSHCRTTILAAVATHPVGTSDLLMVATDGVYFRTTHPGLPVSPTELGKWDQTTLEGLTIVMPGVHYSDKGRDAIAAGGAVKVKSRGIPAAAFAASIASLDRGFRRLAEDPTLLENWPKMQVPIKFQVTPPVSALARGKWGLAGTVQRDISRELSTDPTAKRVGPLVQPSLFLVERLPYVRGGVVYTWPYEQGDVVQSAPYDRRFGMPESATAQFGLGLDDDNLTVFNEVLKGTV